MTHLSCCLILHLVAACLSAGDTVAATERETSDVFSYKDRLEKLEKTVQLLREQTSQPKSETDQPLDTKDSASHHQNFQSSAKRSDDYGSLGPVVEAVSSRVTQLEAQVTALQHDNTQLQQELQTQGSVYVRWGSTTCPNHTDTIYSGYLGGSLESDHGSGSNVLCLPPNPVYDNLKRTDCGPSTIYGGEYEVCPDPHHNMDIVCTLCRSPRSTSVMIPAINECPNGWTTEYTGHLMSNYGGYAASTDYICVDANPQDRPGGQQNEHGARLYYTVSRCVSLPCPPYQNDKILSCVVCSR